MRTLNRSIALRTQITDTLTTSAPQLEASQSSIFAYVQEEKAHVGSHPPSTLVVGEVFATDPQIHYLAKVNQSYSDYKYEKRHQNWGVEIQI